MPDPIINPNPAAPVAAAPAAAPAAVVPPINPVVPAGQPDAGWRDQLPESVRQWEEVSTAKDATAFWDDITNMRGRMGQSVRVPSGEAGEEDWAAFTNKMGELAPGKFTTIPNRDHPEEVAAFYKSIGVPEDAANYVDVESTEQVPIDLEVAGAFKAIAHKHGLTPAQYAGVVADYNAMQNQAMNVAGQPMKDGIASLKGEWGQAFDQRSEQIANMLTSFGFSEAAAQAFRDGNADASSVKGFYKLYEHLGGEGGGIIDPAPGGGARSALSPAEAEARIQEIMNGHEYNSHDVTIRKGAVERMVELQEYVTATASENIVIGGR